MCRSPGEAVDHGIAPEDTVFKQWSIPWDSRGKRGSLSFITRSQAPLGCTGADDVWRGRTFYGWTVTEEGEREREREGERERESEEWSYVGAWTRWGVYSQPLHTRTCGAGFSHYLFSAFCCLTSSYSSSAGWKSRSHRWYRPFLHLTHGEKKDQPTALSRGELTQCSCMERQWHLSSGVLSVTGGGWGVLMWDHWRGPLHVLVHFEEAKRLLPQHSHFRCQRQRPSCVFHKPLLLRDLARCSEWSRLLLINTEPNLYVDALLSGCRNRGVWSGSVTDFTSTVDLKVEEHCSPPPFLFCKFYTQHISARILQPKL